LIFPNYLMHTAYPFNVDGERRSFSFNVKILFKKWFTNQFISYTISLTDLIHIAGTNC